MCYENTDLITLIYRQHGRDKNALVNVVTRVRTRVLQQGETEVEMGRVGGVRN